MRNIFHICGNFLLLFQWAETEERMDETEERMDETKGWGMKQKDEICDWKGRKWVDLAGSGGDGIVKYINN